MQHKPGGEFRVSKWKASPCISYSQFEIGPFVLCPSFCGAFNPSLNGSALTQVARSLQANAVATSQLSHSLPIHIMALWPPHPPLPSKSSLTPS